MSNFGQPLRYGPSVGLRSAAGWGRGGVSTPPPPIPTPIFVAPFADLGGGIANITPTVATAPATAFSRATPAFTALPSGVLVSVAANQPRSVTLGGTYGGLYLEPQATNSIFDSQTLDSANWFNTNLASNVQGAIAPDGTATAWTATVNTASGNHRVFSNSPLVAGPACSSIYAKAGTASWLLLIGRNGGSPANYGVWFDLANGVVGTVGGLVSGYFMSPLGNGWYRCGVVGDPTGQGIVNANVQTANGQEAWVGDGTSNILLWGAQCERGNFTTSYIPTTTVAETRAADILTYASAGNVVGTTGALTAQVSVAQVVDTINVLTVVGFGGTSFALSQIGETAGITDSTNPLTRPNSYADRAPVLMGSGWGATGLQLVANGAGLVTGPFDGNMDVTAIRVGNGSASQFAGAIRNLTIYPSQVTDDQLAELTTP